MNPESPVLAAIAELESLENPDEIDSTVLWQLEEGRRREGAFADEGWTIVSGWPSRIRMYDADWNLTADTARGDHIPISVSDD